MRGILPEDLATNILENIKPPVLEGLDQPYWSLETSGEFSVRSAWEFLRSRRDSASSYSKMWVKGLPFKISFFMWKLWKGILPLDDAPRWLGYFMPSKCWCCVNPD